MINDYYVEMQKLEEIFKLLVKKKVDISDLLFSKDFSIYNYYRYRPECLTKEEFSKIKNFILEYKRYNTLWKN